MNKGRGRLSIIYGIGLAFFITVVPIVIYQSMWPFVVEYYPLVLSVASVTSGFLFVYFYFKGYSWHRMKVKIKGFFIQSRDVKEYMSDRFVMGDQFYKDKSVLILGVALMIAGFYFLARYDASRLPQQEAQRGGLIQGR
jgi:hypothetical protein